MAKRLVALQKFEEVKSKLTFGKYIGYTLEQVMSKHPEYVEWAMYENIISVTDQIQEMVYDCLSYPRR